MTNSTPAQEALLKAAKELVHSMRALSWTSPVRVSAEKAIAAVEAKSKPVGLPDGPWRYEELSECILDRNSISVGIEVESLNYHEAAKRQAMYMVNAVLAIPLLSLLAHTVDDLVKGKDEFSISQTKYLKQLAKEALAIISGETKP